MSISRKKYLVVGAGPVGTKVALGLKEKFGDSAIIEVVDKRLQAGNRHEILLLSKDSLAKLPDDVQRYLFDADDKGKLRAFRSSSIYHYKHKQVPETHAIIKIHDLEHGLCNAVSNRNIHIQRGLEFVTAQDGKATFKDTATNQVIEKEYDELILSIGLSGTLSHVNTEKAAFEVPRLLHSFPVAIARFKADFRDFDPQQKPTSVLCFTHDRLAFFFVTPDSFSTCISIPPALVNKLASSEEALLQFVKESTEAIPSELKYYLDKTDISKPEMIRSVPAVATLTPKLIDTQQHIHFIGDMVATFPYVWGSETNVAYNILVPLLEDVLGKIADCSSEERQQHLLAYEAAVKKAITENPYFLRLSPFGETISLGETSGLLRNELKYSFPGWEQLTQANPYSKENKAQLMPLQELSLPVVVAANNRVTQIGLFAVSSRSVANELLQQKTESGVSLCKSQ